jgi:hypothetical protein
MMNIKNSPNIKKCLVCEKEILKKEFKRVNYFSMQKYCSKECRDIFYEFKRHHPNSNDISSAFSRGMLFESLVKKYLENQGYYIVKSHLSQGLFDLVGFKDNKVFGFSVSTSEESKDKERMNKDLNEFNEKNPGTEIILVGYDKEKKLITQRKWTKPSNNNPSNIEEECDVRQFVSGTQVKKHRTVSQIFIEDKLLLKVWQNKNNGQKCVTIPKDSDLQVGDEVWISDIDKKELETIKKEEEIKNSIKKVENQKKWDKTYNNKPEIKEKKKEYNKIRYKSIKSLKNTLADTKTPEASE